MKLLRLEIQDHFRSLHSGFEIKFHDLARDDMSKFRPFCFAGLNGSGKSNVLEALANIFYHLEICVARNLPESIRSGANFNRTECSPNAFTLEYLIGRHDSKPYTLPYFYKVKVVKEVNKEPILTIQEYPFDKSVKEVDISMHITPGSDQSAPAKSYLPDHVIGYSSGENEILSLPFIKSRLVHLDEYSQYSFAGVKEFISSENSLIYVDNNMSQAVLLACLLFEDEETLAPLRDVDNTGILGLKSFRMHINLHQFQWIDDEGDERKITRKPILELLENNQLEKLKKCATCWFDDGAVLRLDFLVNDATKEAFRHHFNNSSLECFQLFRILYELNSHFVKDNIKNDIYQSKGVYTDGKLPEGSPQQDVFHFLDFYIIKEIKKTGEIKDLLLRSFSDGEHQFIHTMGVCLLLKDKRSILLLDEPETHFNPSWRAKFIKVLNDSISVGNKKDYPNGNFNVHLLKDILLTSHSPFIISDCLPNNVVLFEKDEDGKTIAKKVSEMDDSFNTYGTSVELILDRLFNYRQSIGDLAFSEFENIDFSNLDSSEKVQKEKEKLKMLGESIEKDMVLARLNRISMNK